MKTMPESLPISLRALLIWAFVACVVFVPALAGAQTLVSSDIPNGWTHSGQRAVFYNGQNYFLIYTKGDGAIYYRADADNLGAWDQAETAIVTDHSLSRLSFDIYLVDDNRFDLVYRQEVSKDVNVVTCSISGQTITPDAGSIVLNTPVDNMAVARTSSAGRIFVIMRSTGSIRVYSADQTGDAAGVSTWTEEMSGNEENYAAGEVTIVPFPSSDKVLVIYQIDEGGQWSDGIFSRELSRGGGPGTRTQIGNLNDVGTLTNAVAISDTDFRYIQRQSPGSSDYMDEYKWDGTTWSWVQRLDWATDQEWPSLFYDRMTGDMHVISLDTGTDNIERHTKPSGGSWLTEVVIDGGESNTHSLPISPMEGTPLGSPRVSPRQLVWAYRVDNGSNFDLYVGNMLLVDVANDPPVIAVAIADTVVVEDSNPTDNYRDLNSVFSDTEDGTALFFSIDSNSNPGVVAVTIDADSALDFTYGANANGVAAIVIRATDSGALSVVDSFVVTVTAVNDTPIVVASIPDTTISISNPPINEFRYLRDVFRDAEEGGALAFSIQSNSNPGLVAVVIDADSALDMSFTPLQIGGATIVVRASDSFGLYVDEAFDVSVSTTTIVVSAERLWNSVVRPGDPPLSMFWLSLSNEDPVPDTLSSVTFTNTTVGPGSQAELDANFTSLTLIEENGANILAGGSGDPTASFVSGKLTFSNLEAIVAAGDTLNLIVVGGAALGARDGDVLDIRVEDPNDFLFETPVALIANWPLDPQDSFFVDGFVAQQMAVNPVPTAPLSTGSVRNLVLDITLPSNGYEADMLNRLNVTNAGTAVNGVDIAKLEAWVDDGDGSFDEGQDALLGMFSFTGDRWELTGLTHGVSVGGTRIFVTADIAQTSAEGQTLRMTLPTLPDAGAGMASGNDGPIDAEVSNPFSQVVSLSERVVLSAAPLFASVVRPGDRNAVLLHLVATNNYIVPKQVTRLTVTNGTVPPGSASQSDLDGEIVLVALRVDGNDNGTLDSTSVDPLIGTAFFNDGKATFTGLAWDLPPNTSQALFLTADVSLNNARDGDVLGASIDGVFDVDFSDATAVVATWPIDSAPLLVIDGMLAVQITSSSITSATLAPNDGPILALDVILPANGYAADVLNGFEVVNLGSATDADLTDVRIWRDGGDGLFSSGGGDDVEITPLVWTGSAWKTPVVSEDLQVGGTRFFVGITVSAAPTDSTTVSLAVPIGGITVESGNDGPIDATVANDKNLLLSSAPLLCALETVTNASVVGQNVSVRMIVRNVGGEQIDGIVPSVLVESGSASMTFISGPQPLTINLAPSQIDTFTWVYNSTSSGTIAWTGNGSGMGAVSGLTRTTLAAASNTHQVFQAAGSVGLFAFDSMPFLVNRGETDIVPVSLTFSPSGNQSAADVRLLRLKIRLEDDQGAAIIPSDLLSRVTVSEGNTTYLAKTTMETTGDEVDLTLATPVVVAGMDQVTLAIRLDVLASTLVPAFRVVIEDSSWIESEDAISGAPVMTALQQGSFPFQSGVGRIVVAPTDLNAKALSATDQRVGWAQKDVTLLTLELDNPGVDGLTTNVRVASVALSVTDTNGVAIGTPSQVFENIRVYDVSGTFAVRQLGAQDSTIFSIPLSPTPAVVVNTPLKLIFVTDVVTGATPGVYRLRLAVPPGLDARDANTGSSVPVIYQSIPVEGANLTVEAPADSVLVTGSPMFPSAVAVGQNDVVAFTAAFRHPSALTTGRIRIDEITLTCQDEARAPLVPGTFIDRVRVFQGALEIANTTNIPNSGSQITVPLSAVLMEPLELAVFDVRVDLSATAPISFLEILLDGNDVVATDANLGTNVVVAPDVAASLPITSGLVQLSPPATELVVGMTSTMPAAHVPGATGVPVANVALTNTATPGAGSIMIDHFIIRAAGQNFGSLSIGSFARRVLIYAGGSLVAQSDSLAADSTSAYIPISPALVILPGSVLTIELRMDCQSSPGVDVARLGFDKNDVGVVQPASALLQVRREPVSGQSFPMWTGTGSFSRVSLDGSYSNFPNPFAAGGEATTFVYYLRNDAHVSLKIWTVRGEAVTTLRSSSLRGAGLYQDDLWDGRNGNGRVVVNGVYIAELTIRYVDGTRDRMLRKVAVVR